MPRSFMDLFRPFTSAYDEEEAEDVDPIAALVQQKQRKAEQAKEYTRWLAEVDPAGGDVLVDEDLGVEVRGNLPPLLKVELRSLFSRYKGAQSAPEPAAPAKRPPPRRSVVPPPAAPPSTRGEPEDDLDIEGEEIDPEILRQTFESLDIEPEEDELEVPEERYPRAKAFEEQLEERRRQIADHQRRRTGKTKLRNTRKR